MLPMFTLITPIICVCWCLKLYLPERNSHPSCIRVKPHLRTPILARYFQTVIFKPARCRRVSVSVEKIVSPSEASQKRKFELKFQSESGIGIRFAFPARKYNNSVASPTRREIGAIFRISCRFRARFWAAQSRRTYLSRS